MNWRSRAAILAALVTMACAPPGAPEPQANPVFDGDHQASALDFVPTVQSSNTSSRLQAVSAVSRQVVWASGLDGTYTLTTNGGDSWQTRRGLGDRESESLQFRDIHALDESTAYMLSAGEGDVSRIYKTHDGGASWELQFRNVEPKGFLDCFDFWDRDRGIAYGDSIDGELFVLVTEDGANWTRIPPSSLPAAGEGEGGFAASGTCVETGHSGLARIATGAGGNARVLTTEDYGETWSSADTPTVRGGAAGLMSVLFRSRQQGVALGGDLEQAEAFTANVAILEDGGTRWSAGGLLPFPGAAYGGAWRQGALIAAGPGGIAGSLDSGRSWQPLSDLDTWAVDYGDDDTFWAVGPEGRITRFERVR